MKEIGLLTRAIAFLKVLDMSKVVPPDRGEPDDGGGAVVVAGGGLEPFRLLPQTVQKTASSALVAPHLPQIKLDKMKFFAL
jgi:hypothetical protein